MSCNGNAIFSAGLLTRWANLGDMKTSTIQSVSIFLFILPASVALAGDDVYFERISSGLANGVSADGTVVVGENNSGAFIWTLDGVTNIGESDAIAASADGSFIIGDTSSGPGNSAGRYEAGVWTIFGGLGRSGCDASLSSAYDISGDGQRCVGLGWDGCSASGFLWSASEGMFELPRIGTSSTRANTISGDGGVIGGWDQASNGSRRAAVWYENSKTGMWDEFLPLEGTIGNAAGYGEVSGCNGDGSILVGSANGSGNSNSGAFVIREGEGFELLGLLPPEASPVTGGALDISADGEIVVGFQREGFGGGQSFRATIWTPESGYVELKQYLNDLGAGIPEAFILAAAQSISEDGRVICGWGYEGAFFFQEAWVVVLPGEDVPCPADLNGDGMVGGADLGLLLAAWGTADPAADLNGSGSVDGGDLGLLLSAWGACP